MTLDKINTTALQTAGALQALLCVFCCHQGFRILPPEGFSTTLLRISSASSVIFNSLSTFFRENHEFKKRSKQLGNKKKTSFRIRFIKLQLLDKKIVNSH